MKQTINKTDFRFEFAGYGHYRVTYTSPITRKSWSHTTSNMGLIDKTKNEDEPKKCDLKDLKKLCKQGKPEWLLNPSI